MGTPDGEVLRDTLDMLVMKLLATEPMHGWAIANQLKLVSRSALQVSHGSLYPALHRLEHRGWIVAEWRTTDRNRQAKFYKLTAQGRRQLEREALGWRRLVRAVDLIMAKR